MKKSTLSVLLISITGMTAFAQSGVKYSTGGNILASTDIFGSTNNAPVNFVSNGQKWMTLSPSGLFDISGRTRTRSNATFDSSATAFAMIAQQAQFATALVTGQITAGSLVVNGNATINGQLTIDNITSATGTIDFGNSNLVTSGNVNSTNISALQTSVSNQQTQITNLNAQISGITSSQWTTNSDSSISFPGSAFVKSMNISESLKIGNFRFSNGGGITPAPVDSIISPKPIAIASSKSISLGADTVLFGNGTGKVGITPSPITGNVRLQVQGDVEASGNISSNTITASQITINGMLESDTMHARRELFVNSSLKLSREPSNSFAEVSTLDTGVALVLQNTSTGRVGIGITPSAGEKLSVAGNAKFTGNISANCVTVNCLNVSGATQFDSVRVLKKLKIGTGTLILQNDPGGLENSIYTDNTTTPPSVSTDLLIQCNAAYPNNTFINKDNSGSVIIGTSTNIPFPDAKLQVLQDNKFQSAFKIHKLVCSKPEITSNPSGCLPNIMRVTKETTGIPGIQTLFVIQDTGNVGIGIVNPQDKLDVNGFGRFTNGLNFSDYLELGHSGSNSTIDNFGTGNLILNYNSGKFVGIGLVNPQYYSYPRI